MNSSGRHFAGVIVFSIPLLFACTGGVKKCSEGCAVGTRCDTPTQLCVRNNLSIVTKSLPDGKVGQLYNVPLAAMGGEKPYEFSVVQKAPSLSWLRFDEMSSTLSGTPGEPATLAKVVVSVTDTTAFSIQRELTLQVAGCTNGEMTVCTREASGVCTVGMQVCAGGRVAEECLGSPSTDVQRCGPGCGLCGATADGCRGGLCQCGTGPACKDGEACCGGTCKSLGDVASCGSCSNNCTAKAGVNASALCTNGECSFVCQATYAVCSGKAPKAGEACAVNLGTDVQNCGACGAQCKPTVNETSVNSSCKNSSCVFACKPGFLDCDGNQNQNGCETPVSTANCSACGQACAPRGNADVSCINPTSASPSCTFACKPDFENCNAKESDGCEVNTSQSLQHCGGCGKSCGPAADNCQDGKCKCGAGAPCGPGLTCSAGICVCGPNCVGCCKNGLCESGLAYDSCGILGEACQACGKCPPPSTFDAECAPYPDSEGVELQEHVPHR